MPVLPPNSIVHFQVLKNVENDLPNTEEPRNGVRVGWSATGAGLQLGKYCIMSGNSLGILGFNWKEKETRAAKLQKQTPQYQSSLTILKLTDITWLLLFNDLCRWRRFIIWFWEYWKIMYCFRILRVWSKLYARRCNWLLLGEFMRWKCSNEHGCKWMQIKYIKSPSK